MIELVLGGARSGKSSYAEQQAIDSGLEVTYIATATVYDQEMADRVEHHRQQRPDHWPVVEEPVELAEVLKREAREDRCLLVDCLTLWVSNLLCMDDTDAWPTKRQELLNVLSELPGRIIMVSNEVGMGIIPMGELTRRYVDESGRLHQAIARSADKVTFVAAGLPLVMKGSKH
ncbi:bifunctional adenosylcobinamide kinase/adenosylcobinamide-phosphate guanylyltransferase [Parendozoicomonas haliclonae]|uniref:Bifunctional adenosylcobalamin biosynthesis protein n=1 Tax=Parendozoicomonas haliclonae TaxID=1960125 RepID=A0A1X7AM95_9GAMM|nr:bifunctional adenosylcobinamide kinase/adenosylcobinamide-phosphate guanylyltransferase [Parendozoicomonas haliclonae]SMA48857.1 Bifunctional adenosylcobalamin biosynthesis protein CobP [Parendozoicomonas haliclonae]